MRTRRRLGVWVGLGLLVGAYDACDLAAPPVGLAGPKTIERRDDPPPADRTARRRWALAKMDEMVWEKRRCRERFRVTRQIGECEAQYARRYRAYNAIYLEASRE